MNKKILFAVLFIIILIIGGLIIYFVNTSNNSVTSNEIVNNNNGSSNSADLTDSNIGSDKKILVAYFSKSGENYGVGTVEKGNTELMAENIADITGGDLYKIDPVVAYPDSYEEAKEVATREKDNNARPEIKIKIDSFSEYNTIFIGYPIWYGDYPMIINTFLESYDFTDKIVIPFNTHAGSGSSGTYEKIENKLSNSKILDGLAISGSDARKDSSKDTIKTWINKLGL